MNETSACIGTFRMILNGDVLEVHSISAVDGADLDRVYESRPLPEEYLETARCPFLDMSHSIGYGFVLPEDVEEHFGLELGCEILLGFFRACEAQFKGLIEGGSDGNVILAFQMMERAHDTLAMAMARRKMAI